jgi:ABC-type branched-subunit amino acid transport system substrate-binding protein
MRKHSAALYLGPRSGCSQRRHRLRPGQSIKIRAIPINGPGAYFGAQDKQGIELAIEQINKTGVGGYKLEIQYEDSACSPLPATQAAKRLLDQYKPHVVIGEECSDATLAVMPLMEQAKVPLLNAGSSSIRITSPATADLPHHAQRGDAGRGHREQRLQASQRS